MSHMILKLLGSPSFFQRVRIATPPRPIDSGSGVSRYSPDNLPLAVSELADETKPSRRHWLWLGLGPKVEISRARFTPVEEMMLNLP